MAEPVGEPGLEGLLSHVAGAFLINDAIDPEAATAGSALEVALEALVAGSEECAVWYPAGDLTGVDVVDDERVFVSRILPAVAGGDIEPCLRFVRRGA